MENIRSSVFETNSSSTHSLTIVPGDIIDLDLSKEQLRSGIIDVRLRTIESNNYRYYNLINKINYILVSIVDTYDMEPFAGKRLSDVLEESARFNILRDLVKKVTGCKIQLLDDVDDVMENVNVLDIGSRDYIYEIFYDDDKLKSFLFSKESFVDIRYDSDKVTDLVKSDIGIVSRMDNLPKEPVDGENSVWLTIALNDSNSMPRIKYPHEDEFEMVGMSQLEFDKFMRFFEKIPCTGLKSESDAKTEFLTYLKSAAGGLKISIIDGLEEIHDPEIGDKLAMEFKMSDENLNSFQDYVVDWFSGSTPSMRK